MKPRPSLATLVALLATAPFAFGQTSVQSGSWSDPITWGGSVPTSLTFTIDGPHTVTAGSGVTFSNTSTNPFVYGTLNVNNGASLTVRRINSGADSREGARTINVNDGGFLSMEFGAGTFNVESGGHLEFRGNSIGSGTINIKAGGTVRALQGGTSNQVYNLNGGHLIYENGLTDIGTITWTGGTVTSNGFGSGINSNRMSRFVAGLNSNAANVWNLSSKTEKVVAVVPSGSNVGSFSIDKGTVEFDVYSSALNDSDQIKFENSGRLNFTADVTFNINGVNLSGAVGDYLGQTYKLLDYTSGSYSDVLASISSTVWTIGGSDYDVTFINNLATDGSITVDGLTPSQIPEPSTIAVLAGIGALGFTALRRRHR